MKKPEITNKFNKLFVIALSLVAIILLPEIYHPIYYNIIPKYSCNSYTGKKSNEIFEIFNNKSDFTIMESSLFLYNCKIKNSVPLMYYLPLHMHKNAKNPFSVVTMPYIINSEPIFVANKMLADLMNVAPAPLDKAQPYEHNKKVYFDYWAPKIKSGFDFFVNPL